MCCAVLRALHTLQPTALKLRVRLTRYTSYIASLFNVCVLHACIAQYLENSYMSSHISRNHSLFMHSKLSLDCPLYNTAAVSQRNSH